MGSPRRARVVDLDTQGTQNRDTVATTQRTRTTKQTKQAKPARKSRPAKAAKKPSKATAASSRTSPRAKGSARGGADTPTAGGLTAAFVGFGRDFAGVSLIVAGAVAGLGLYADLSGPVGRAMARALELSVGRVAYAVPVALVVIGVALVRRRPGPPVDPHHGAVVADAVDDADTEPAWSATRLAIGAAMVLIAVTGGLQLALGRPALDGPAADLEAAGGYLGAALATPVAGLIGVVATWLVLVAVGLVGVAIAANRNLHQVSRDLSRVVAPLWALVARTWRSLFTLGPADGHDADSDAPDATDAAADPVAADGPSLGVPETPAWLVDPGAPAPTVVVAGAHDPDDPSGDPADEAGGDPLEVPDWLGATPQGDASADPDDTPGGMADDTPADTGDDTADVIDEAGVPTGPPEQLTIDLSGPPANWSLPRANLLRRSDRHEVDASLVEQRGKLLEQALAEHGVTTRLVGMVVGPTVTRYELELGPGVKVAKVTSLNRDIAYAMASPDVRILAPIPGRQAIGVEVPNDDRQVVSLGDVLGSGEAERATEPLEVALGRDINGKNILVDLATMPHLLIAGQTGAGKSSCINSLITSVLMRSTPDEVRMILIDPKRVELGQYNRLPHLLTQVVTNPKKAANALSWAVREMERRYDLLSETGFRDIGGYNAAVDSGALEAPAPEPTGDPEAPDTLAFRRLPYVLVVVDELNDLMMVAARDVEESICRIAQMARAVGIHLVVATQRPSVNVITGVIKANIPARMAFAVSSLADSRVILDQPGAERLVGRGDMLLVGASSSVAQRIQGCWVDEAEVRAVVGHWRRQAPDVAFDDTAVQGTDEGGSPGGGGGASGAGGDDDDELLAEATELVVRSQLGSTSMLQRKLRVGFARAGRIMDLLEQRGVVGPSEGSKARAVLMTPDELDGAPSPSSGDGDDADGGSATT